MDDFNYKAWVKNAFFHIRHNPVEYDQYEKTPNWCIVNYLFGCGRTQATQYCHQLNIDPDSSSTKEV